MLEIQMVQVEDSVDGLGVDLTELEGDVDFLFDDQLIQDQRIFNVEEESSDLNENVQGMSDFTVLTNFVKKSCQKKANKHQGQVVWKFKKLLSAGLQITTFQLDQRVETLEENGGSDGNSSVAELEVRVETLETTVSGQEVRLNTTKSGLDGNL